ncbi:flippase-like domain-containing protein [Rhodobacteraceae bacterium CCMM004]|nr:flippase-like domain-containing protein [Rhodobacteraceae bacterium CCMM004]
MDMTRPPAPLPAPPRRWRDALVLGALLAAMLGGLAALASATGWEASLAQLARLGPLEIGALLALSLVNYLGRALRWHVFVRRLGLPLGLAASLRHFLGGFAMSVTPGRVGELVRMRWIGRETGWSFDRTAPLALVDRAADLAAMGLILGAALAAMSGGIAGAVPVAVAAVAAAVAVTRPATLRVLATRAHGLIGRWSRLFARIRGAARSLARVSDPRTMTLALFLGAAGWLAEGYALHLLLVWLGADIGAAAAIAIFVFATLAGGLTGAPGGLGGAEAAMVALLSVQGVPLEISIPATAIIRLTTLWFALAIGLAVFPHAERRAARALGRG